jgi:hypothetical protein
MKLLLVITLTLSTMAFASADKFEARKAKRIEMLDKVIANLNKSKSCIQAAKDKEAIKACGKDRKQMREGLKAERVKRKSEKKQ